MNGAARIKKASEASGEGPGARDGIAEATITRPATASPINWVSAMPDASIGIAFVALDGKIHDANPAFCSVVGVPLNLAIGQHLADLGLLDGYGADLPDEAQSLRWQVEVDVPATRRLIEISLHNAGDRFICTATDLSTIDALRAASAESEQRFETLFQHAPMAIFFYRKDGTILRANRAAELLLGRTREELILHNALEFEQYEIKNGLRDAFVRAWQGSQSMGDVPMRLTRSDGEIREIIKRIDPFRMDGEDGMLCFILDITDHHATEHALQQSEDRFSKAFRTAPVAMLLGRYDGQLIDINLETEALTGYTRSELIGHSTLDLGIWNYEAAGLLRSDRLEQFERDGRIQAQPSQIIRKDGDFRDVLVSSEKVAIDGETAILSLIIDVTQRSQIEAELASSEERFQKAFNASPVAIAIAGLDDSTISDVNERFLAMFRGNLETIVGSSGSRLNLWGDRRERSRAYDAIRRGERYTSGLTSFRRLNGELFPGIFTFDVIETGGAARSLIHIQDLSDLELVRAELQKGEQRLSSILTLSRDVIGIIDREMRIELVSENAAQFLGYERLAAQEIMVEAFHHPDDLPKVLETLQTVLATSNLTRRVEHRMRRGNGEWQWVETTLTNLTHEPSINGALFSIHDMSERHAADDELRMRGFLLDEAPAAIIAITQDGVIRRWNRQAETLLGWSRDETIGVSLSHLADHGSFHVLARTMLDRARSGQRWEGEAQLLDRNGAEIDIQASSIPLNDLGGRGPGMVAVIVDVSDRKRAEEQLDLLAHTDKLTGLANRNRFVDRLRTSLSALDKDETAAIFFINIDQFRALNESLGHEHGDEALRLTAQRLVEAVGNRGHVARFSGDSFSVVVYPYTQEQAAILAQSIHDALQLPYEIKGRKRLLTSSIGYTVATSRRDISSVLREADTAQREARLSTPNRPVMFEPAMAARAQRRLDLETDLRLAVSTGQFVLHYQPIVSLSARTIVGGEALIRWQRDDGTLIAPGEFISLAEETGLIIPLGQWVLEEACRAINRFDQAIKHRHIPSVHVNISAAQFRQPNFAGLVMSILAEHGVAPDRITLEVTESTTMVDAEQAIRQLQSLRDTGVRLAIDDFGAGYSNLGLLNRLPVQSLKIDRSFAAGMETDPGMVAITRSLVALGRDLGMNVTAEGIETSDQADRLAALGCNRGQGYFFARPMPEEAYRDLIAHGPSARLPV